MQKSIIVHGKKCSKNRLTSISGKPIFMSLKNVSAVLNKNPDKFSVTSCYFSQKMVYYPKEVFL